MIGRSSSEKQAAVFIVIAASAIILSIVSYQYYLTTAREIGRVVSTDIQKQTRAESFYLSRLLESRIGLVDNSLATLAVSPAIVGGDELGARNAINKRQLHTSDISDRYVWLDSAGKTVWSSGFQNEDEYIQYKGADVSFRQYFIEPRDTGRPYYSTVIDSLDGVPRLFLSRPVLLQDERGNLGFAGVVFSAITLEKLGQNLERQLSPEITADIFITDETGVIAYSDDKEDIGKRLDSSIVPVDDSEAFDEFMSRPLKDQSSLDFLVSNAGIHTMASSQVQMGNENFLSVYVMAPHNVATTVDPLLRQHNNFITLIILGIGAGAAGMAYVVVSWNRALQSSVARQTRELKVANEELQKANKQLAVNDRLQKEFINIAAHELRTPIQPVLGMTEMLEPELGEKREDIRLIARNARRLERLTQDILDVSRIESQSLRLDIENFSLQDLVIQLVEEYRNQGTSPRILYERQADVVVEADKERIAQVISNLLSNAVKFTEAKGVISINTSNEENKVYCSVTDTGTGIDPEIKPRLFTKFASKSQRGTGLGLFISKSIIEAHGGKIWGENNSRGGATFTFSLPAGD